MARGAILGRASRWRPGLGRARLKRKEYGAYGMHGAPRRETGREERRTGRRSVLRANENSGHPVPCSHSNCLASAGCIFEEEPGSQCSAVSHSLSGCTRLALHCKLSNLPQIYNACPSPLPGSENRHCLGCFDMIFVFILYSVMPHAHS